MIKWLNQQKRENFNAPGGCGAWRFHDDFSHGAKGGGDLCTVIYGDYAWHLSIAWRYLWKVYWLKRHCAFVIISCVEQEINYLSGKKLSTSICTTLFLYQLRKYTTSRCLSTQRRNCSSIQAEGATSLTVIFSPPATLSLVLYRVD